MGKIKEALLDDMSSHEMEQYLYNRHLRDAEYEDWYNGEGYVAFVNEELESTKLKYSTSDVESAIMYGVSAVQVTAEEVGSDVYGKLLHEKVFEYLNTNKE